MNEQTTMRNVRKDVIELVKELKKIDPVTFKSQQQVIELAIIKLYNSYKNSYLTPIINKNGSKT